MSQAYRVEPLDAQKHDRAAFACERPPLDEYLKTRANKEAKQNVAQSYVLCNQADPTRIIGYYSISAYIVETTHLPEIFTRRLPRYDALPTILIGRLAIDARYQKQGFGELLLMDALKRCYRISRDMGAIAVLVDAKDDGAARFYERYSFRRCIDRPLSLFLPMAEIAQLAERKQ